MSTEIKELDSGITKTILLESEIIEEIELESGITKTILLESEIELES